jgi:hypothetical protein
MRYVLYLNPATGGRAESPQTLTPRQKEKGTATVRTRAMFEKSVGFCTLTSVLRRGRDSRRARGRRKSEIRNRGGRGRGADEKEEKRKAEKKRESGGLFFLEKVSVHNALF